MRATLLLRSTHRSGRILRLRRPRVPAKVTKEAEPESNKEQRREEETSNGSNPFSDMKQQFFHFKRDKYL